MKINIPKIVKKVEMAGYAPELAGAALMVWVNPARALLAELVAKDTSTERKAEIFAELWSQGPEDTRWTGEEVLVLIVSTFETDPKLFEWMRDQTLGAIGEHRAGLKKA